jgi:hypothetical protein
MAQTDRKEKIFELFNQNLKWFLEVPSLSIKDSESNKVTQPEYICPVCFDAFNYQDLNGDLKNPLTLEDVPPKKLGGKVKTLTCRSCNNKAGHKLDVKLKTWLNNKESQNFLPNSQTKAKYLIDGNEVNGTFSVANTGEIVIDLDTKRSNPKHAEEFTKKVNPHGTTQMSIHPIQKKADNREAEIALLRIAYLEAFSLCGYGFMLNGYLGKIREQIQHPEKSILPKVLWLNYEFDDEQNGINIITQPKELRCFLIVFDIVTESGKYKCAIALPGPSAPGIEIYNNIENLLCQDSSGDIEIKIEHLDTTDNLRTKEYTFDTYNSWKKYCE